MLGESYFHDFIVSINVLSLMVALGLYALIWLYLSKKLTGMQTPFDQMVKDLLVLAYLGSVQSCILYMKLSIFVKYPPAALFYLYFSNIAGQSLFIQIFLTVFMRYLYIFHSWWINDVNDMTIIKVARSINMSVSIFLATLEMNLFDHRSGEIFQMMTEIPNESPVNFQAPTIKITVMMMLAMILFVQIRIEVARRNTQEKMPDFGYSSWTLRFLVFLLASSGALVILWFAVEVTVIKRNYGKGEIRMIINATVTILMNNLLPSVMILRNHSMTSWTQNQILIKY